MKRTYSQGLTRAYCDIHIETNKTRAICPICRERLKGGDKSIRFIADIYYGHINFKKFHIVCWLSQMPCSISIKELSLAKRRAILRDI